MSLKKLKVMTVVGTRPEIDRYGSTQLWRDTLRDFACASPLLPDYLGPLVDQMRQSGRALEQESVWLPVR